ncbi:hypothetical protein [Methylorubrum aminovorans]
MLAPCRAEGANAAGFGLTSCADAALLFDQPAYRSAFFIWTLGFATGVNNVLVVRDRQFSDLSGQNADLVVGSTKSASPPPTGPVDIEVGQFLHSAEALRFCVQRVVQFACQA